MIPAPAPRTVRYAVALTVLLLCRPALAAPPPSVPPGLGGTLEQLRRPSERPLQPPSPRPETPVPFRLPPVETQPPAGGRLSAGPRVLIKRVVVEGNTVFDASALQALTAEYTGRYLTSEDLETLRRRLTLYYVERGYISSGAVIPDQRVAGGVLHVRIVEGRLTDLEVDGLTQLAPGYVRRRLRLGAGPPLNVNDLQERLKILLQGPMIERIAAELQPGERPGEARLVAQVEESSPYRIHIGADNHLSPTVGTFRKLLGGQLTNLTGWGDTLGIELGFAGGLIDRFLDFSVPVTSRDTTLAVHISDIRSEVVEEPFNRIDITSRSRSYAIELTHPFIQTSRERLALGLSVERRRSESFLFGIPFSFSPGVREGRSTVSVVRLSQDWLRRRARQVFAVRSTFSLGIDAFGSTINDRAPDSRFLAWLGQMQWIGRVGSQGGEILARLNVQLSNDGLLPVEKFSVGGGDSVRGYRNNQLVRDRGYFASVEYRHPLVKDANGRVALSLAPFVDIGGAWNKGAPTPEPRTISSLGLGLRWDPHPKVHAEVYWGLALRNVDNPSHDLQDSGVHFALTAAWD